MKLEKDFAYLEAIINWNTKKILSWKLSSEEQNDDNPAQRRTIYSKDHIDVLVQNNISISMYTKRRSIDKIVIERF